MAEIKIILKFLTILEINGRLICLFSSLHYDYGIFLASPKTNMEKNYFSFHPKLIFIIQYLEYSFPLYLYFF